MESQFQYKLRFRRYICNLRFSRASSVLYIWIIAQSPIRQHWAVAAAAAVDEVILFSLVQLSLKRKGSKEGHKAEKKAPQTPVEVSGNPHNYVQRNCLFVLLLCVAISKIVATYCKI